MSAEFAIPSADYVTCRQSVRHHVPRGQPPFVTGTSDRVASVEWTRTLEGLNLCRLPVAGCRLPVAGVGCSDGREERIGEWPYLTAQTWPGIPLGANVVPHRWRGRETKDQ